MDSHHSMCSYYGIDNYYQFCQQEHQQQRHSTTTTITNSPGGGGGGEYHHGQMFPAKAAASLLQWSLPPADSITPITLPPANNSVSNQDCCFPFLSPPPLYGEIYARRARSLSSSPCGVLQAEFSQIGAREIIDRKALAASKSHSEAERRRRERINSHLAKLRSLLPGTTKIDKASLLAEVIQHLNELKRQTSEIGEESQLPTETDEISVHTVRDENGQSVVRASVCCDDRSDLLQDLIGALKALKLRALRADITTVGRRVRNVIVVTGEDDDTDRHHNQQQSIITIQETLKAVMERAAADETLMSSAVKGQLVSMPEQRPI